MKPTTLMNIFRRYNIDEYSNGMCPSLWESALEDDGNHYIVIQEALGMLHIINVDTVKEAGDGIYNADVISLMA